MVTVKASHSDPWFSLSLWERAGSGRIFELLNQIVIQYALFQLIDGTTGRAGQFFEANPDQESAAGNRVTLNACGTALAALESDHRFAFAVQLLDLPTKATRLLCSRRGDLSAVVGHDPIRAIGKANDPLVSQPTSLPFLLYAFSREPSAFFWSGRLNLI